MLVEFYAYDAINNPNQEEVEDGDFDLEKVMAEMADSEKWQDV